MKLFFLNLCLAATLLPTVNRANEPTRLTTVHANEVGEVAPGADPGATCFMIDVQIDPVESSDGNFQVVASLAVGMKNSDGGRAGQPLLLDLREGSGRASFTLWNGDANLSRPDVDTKKPGWVDTREYQHPNELRQRSSSGYPVRLVVWPEEKGSRIRLFVESMDRPKVDAQLDEFISAGVIKFFALQGGQASAPRHTSVFSDFQFSKPSLEEAKALPDFSEIVLRAIDFSNPKMAPVAAAIRKGDFDRAGELFLHHMRTRSGPKPPSLAEIPATVLHPDWQKIADEVLAGRYGTVGFFTEFTDSWTDTNGETHRWVLQEEPLQINWPRCNGHLNRHFHWVSLAKAWEATGESRYAKRFSDEVFDWVSREPFYWDRNPMIGGLNLMDGTIFRWGYMNTSNIGRRLELTWWPAYETFRKAPEFSDEAHFAMLAGMIRQAELITNPSSFAVHDDGAAHTTMALLQTAVLLPEFKASSEWRELALERWDEMLAQQFHPDGSHVSLSTGYNWATILTLENFLRFYEKLGVTPPKKYFEQLEKALEHPLLITTPSQTQIPLNDGGWSLVDDHFQRSLHWFPYRKDFEWLATRGAKGNPPEAKSLYFPNAGQFLMRTGWGEGEQYLFFGAGPWGASHGKFDALSVYAQFGSHLLIRDAGRGSYSGVGNTVHAGRSLSFNTISPDWAQENSIPHWKQDMHRGFGPPKRRWITNQHYDYGEGTFEYGWHRPGEHIQGKWLRQVLFVKGTNPKRDGYYLVIDTVEPREDIERTWRHPWQLAPNPDQIAFRESDQSVTAITDHAALQILPVDPDGDISARIIQGQEEPELLGWRIYDTTATPYPVPTHEWKARGTFSRAWIIQMQNKEENWPVKSVEAQPTEIPGELRFLVRRKNGGTDAILRRFPGSPPTEFESTNTSGDILILSTDANGATLSKLELENGEDSVAAAANSTPK